MRPSIWTGMYAEVPLDEALSRLAECGWRIFEISTEHLCAIDESEAADAEIERAVSFASDADLAMTQGHLHLGADVAHPDLERRADDVARCERHIEIASRLGAKVVVTHPGRGLGYTTADERRQFLQTNVDAFRRLGDAAAARGMMVAIENMMDNARMAGRRRFGSSTAELIELLETAKHDALGICVDTSHASVQNLDIPAMIRELGPRVIAVHISDNDGSGDQHRTPGGGRVDWRGVVAALRDIGFAYDFNLENPGERHAEADMRKMRVRHALEVTEMLLSW